MAKLEAEHVPKIAIKELLKEGFLSGREAGWIRWHDPFVGYEHLFKISSVFIDEIEDLYPDDEIRKMLPLEGVIEFESTVTGVPQGGSFRFSEQTMIVQSIALKTTPCNYGRRRFWFSCPGIGQKRCFARVGILYWLHGSLACRKCHNLAYKVQNIAKGERGFGRFTPAGEIEQMWKSLKKYSYKGKPTKRYLRVKKKTAEFNQANERWDKNANDIAAFLAGANEHWPQEALADAMSMHLKTTVDEATARLKKDYAADVRAFDAVFDHIMHMSDTLSAGIIKQFPDKF